MADTAKTALNKIFPWILILAGAIGLFASLYLTIEKIHVIADPDYALACDINPLFSCGSVMNTPQAEIAGMPNTLLGVVGFPVLITVGVVMLAGAKMSRRFWQLFNLGMLGGLAGVAWLFIQSVYVISKLCLFCMSVWAVVIIAFWYTLLWSTDQGHIKVPKSLERIYRFKRRHHLDMLIVGFIIITALIISRFWYYFGSL